MFLLDGGDCLCDTTSNWKEAGALGQNMAAVFGRWRLRVFVCKRDQKGQNQTESGCAVVQMRIRQNQDLDKHVNRRASFPFRV